MYGALKHVKEFLRSWQSFALPEKQPIKCTMRLDRAKMNFHREITICLPAREARWIGAIKHDLNIEIRGTWNLDWLCDCGSPIHVEIKSLNLGWKGLSANKDRKGYKYWPVSKCSVQRLGALFPPQGASGGLDMYLSHRNPSGDVGGSFSALSLA